MSAVGAAACKPDHGRSGPPPYSFAGDFLRGFAAGAALVGRLVARLRAIRAFSFRWRVLRRIFIERRLSRLPMDVANTGSRPPCQLYPSRSSRIAGP